MTPSWFLLLVFLLSVTLDAYGVPKTVTQLNAQCNLRLQGVNIHVSEEALDHILFGEFHTERVKLPHTVGYHTHFVSKKIDVYAGGGHTYLGFDYLKSKIENQGLNVLRVDRNGIGQAYSYIKRVRENDGKIQYAVPATYFINELANGSAQVVVSTHMLAWVRINDAFQERVQKLENLGLTEDSDLSFDTPVTNHGISLFPPSISSKEQIVQLIEEAVNHKQAHLHKYNDDSFHLDSFVNINGYDIKVRLVLDPRGNVVTFFPSTNIKQNLTIGDLLEGDLVPESLIPFMEELYALRHTPVAHFKSPKLYRDLLQMTYLLLDQQISFAMEQDAIKTVTELLPNRALRKAMEKFILNWQRTDNFNKRIQLAVDFMKKQTDIATNPNAKEQALKKALLRSNLMLDIRN